MTPSRPAIQRAVVPQVENLTDTPAFEQLLPDTVEAVPPSLGSYVFQTGGSRKGKQIAGFPEKRLNEFIADVDKMVDEGKPIPDALQEDYNVTLEYLGLERG